MKIAIIGAGITGLYLSWKLAQKGQEIVIFEKRKKIGKEVCSGLFSERILDFIPESKNLIENEINGVLIHFPKKTLNVKFQKKFFVMEHSKLDELVLELAKKNNVKILLNKDVKEREILQLSKKFDLIIGCDGANSVIRKYLKLKKPNFYLGIQGFLKSPISANVETWPIKEGGFIWKIPRKEKIEYGIMAKPQKAKILFEKFLKENKIELENIKASLIPQSLILSFHPSIVLLGDAAGLTKPWSGGGVIWGLKAAEILIKNFHHFLKSQKEIKKFFFPQIIFSKMAKNLLYFLGFNFPYILPTNYKIDGDFFHFRF